MLLFCNFFAKNCLKMKEFGPPGGSRPWRPLRSANVIINYYNARIAGPFSTAINSTIAISLNSVFSNSVGHFQGPHYLPKICLSYLRTTLCKRWPLHYVYYDNDSLWFPDKSLTIDLKVYSHLQFVKRERFYTTNYWTFQSRH